MVRLQAVAYAILPVSLGLVQLWHRRAHFSWILGGVGASLAAVLPQILVWWVIYGSPFVLGPGMRESGGSVLHLWSPRFLSVLFSADRGFFSWTRRCCTALAESKMRLLWWPRYVRP